MPLDINDSTEAAVVEPIEESKVVAIRNSLLLAM